jgi:ATP adenylyltransferase
MNCSFCDEFKSGELIFDKDNLGNRILYETDNFIVLPTIGPFVEGYLLTIPKEHYLSMASLPKHLYLELEDVQNRVKEVLTENYSSPLFYEHGPNQESNAGCCVDHAHVHALPVQIDLVKLVNEELSSEQIDTYAEFNEIDYPYLFIEGNNDEKHVFKLDHLIPPQYLRQIIAEQLGFPEKYDWKTHPFVSNLLRTLKTLKGKF